MPDFESGAAAWTISVDDEPIPSSDVALQEPTPFSENPHFFTVPSIWFRFGAPSTFLQRENHARGIGGLGGKRSLAAENRSAEQALKWYDGFIEALQNLEHIPESHSLALENARTSYELRQMLFGIGRRITHRELFRVCGSTVHVLAIRGVAQAELDDT